MNIFDSIAAAAAQYPQRAALVTGNQVFSYHALMLATAGVAQRLRDAGVQSGEVVLLRLADSSTCLLMTLALARLGAVSLATAVPGDLSELMQRCGVTAVVSGAPAAGAVELAPGIRQLDPVALLAPVAATPTDFQTVSLPPTAPWRVALTSGTTGRSKAMLWRHGASLAAWQSTVEPSSPLVDADRVLVFLDIANVFAMHRVLRILSSGATLVLPTNPSPQEFARCVDQYGVTQALTVNSLGLQVLAFVQAAPGPASLRFPGLQRLIVGGESMPRALREDLTTRICGTLVLTYGTSESGPIATADTGFLRAYPGAVGRLLPGTEVAVLDAQGEPLPRGEWGTLRVRTPGMATAYLGDAERGNQVFRDGWYLTGDSGRVDAQGVVSLGSRSEDWLPLAGGAVDPMRLEGVIAELPGMREVVVFLAHQVQRAPMAPHQGPVLAALFTALVALDVEQVRRHCAARLPAHQVPEFLGQIQTLPRTANGKISRHDLGQRFRLESTQAAAPLGGRARP
jgi:long-chain acyl-CoA synthetase